MFTLMCLFSSLMSILFMHSKMPLALTVYLSMNAITVAVIMLSYMKSSWFSFILMMIFLSGMMVIFTYVSSLSSNEFMPSSFTFMTIILMMSIILMLCLMNTQNSDIFLSSNKSILNISQAVSLHKLYEKDSILIMTMMITYLLIALLVVVKNSSLDSAPLRSNTT